MNPNTVRIIAGSYLVVLGASVTHHILTKRQQKKADQERLAQFVRDVKILQAAADRIQMRALTGYYENKSLVDIENDFNFEVIALHEE